MKLNQLLATFAIALAVLITGCKKDDFVEVDGVCPIVVTTDPVNLATDVPLDKIITATFNVPMNPETFVPEVFALDNAKKSTGAATPGVMTYDAATKTMRFVPSSPLANNTTYTATILSKVKDLNGIGLQGNYVWTFSTGALVNPTVILTDPLDLATGVALDKTVTAEFSVPMSSATITAATFTVFNGLVQVPGDVTYAGTTASFNPTDDLLPGVLYTATVTTGAQNVAGTPLASNKIWTFSALGAAPTVILTDPLDEATGVALNKTVTANFSEAMSAATVTGTTFTLFNGLVQVAGDVTYAGTTASFNPTDDLLPGVLYTATLTTGVQNAAGMGLAANKEWTFTTLAAGPTVTLTNPLDLATGVALNQDVTATFSEAMNSATISGTTFTVFNGATQVPGSVTYAGTTATFNPTDDLLPGVLYTATITTGAQNVAGTPVAIDKVWTFTAIGAAPTVTLTDPLDLAVGVVLDQTVTATFSESMNDATISNSTFTIMDGANPVAGLVSYAGNTASFNPSVDLLPGTLYTATITTGVESAGGVTLESDKIWTFTTEVIAPTVVLTDPLNLATGVPNSVVVSADFSEAMNSATITDLTFTLVDELLNPVLGIVDYAGNTATFTPNEFLKSDETYTATITTGAENVGGTSLNSDFVWEFTTGLPAGPGIVDLGTAGDFVIIGKAGISTTGTTSITGDIGVSPVTQTALTGFSQIMDVSGEFSTSPGIVVGNLYASDYAVPTPDKLTTAVSDMETALTVAMGMTLSVINEEGAGIITGLTLVPGLYKWTTGVLIAGGGVTLSGGPDDTWVFQIDQDLVVNGDVILAGGAQAKNIFWVTATQALLNTGVDFSGNIIAGTTISMLAGSKVTGRLLSQTDVTLDAATVVEP